GGATEDVEDLHRVGALGRRNPRAAAHARTLHKGHRAHLDETASSRGIAEDVALGELGVEGSLHARAVGGVPAVNVVESSRTNGRGVGGGLGARVRRIEEGEPDKGSEECPAMTHAYLEIG